jgi:dTDP-4-amino-4,6-dideoxygalactose transaminase
MKGLIPKNKPYYDWRDVLSALSFWQRGSLERFEKKMSDFAEVAHAIAFPYARSAIWALVSLWDDNPSADEVIMPAYTCSVVAHPIVKAGLRPVFVDIDLETYNMKPADVLARVSEKTRAIILVHTHGTVMNVQEVVEGLPRKDILVIEDSALCPKPAFKSHKYSNTVSLYSFDYTKHLSAIEGGAVVTDNGQLAERIHIFHKQYYSTAGPATHAKNALQFAARLFLFNRLGYYWLDKVRNLPVLTSFYDERSMGQVSLPNDATKYLPAWQARLALSQLSKLDFILEKRAERAQWYGENLRDNPGIAVPAAGMKSLWSHYPVRVADRDGRKTRERLKREGIEVGSTFDYVVADLPIFSRFATGDYPNARLAAQEMINLPNYPSITRRQADMISNILLKIL